jgi:hypothetical protein
VFAVVQQIDEYLSFGFVRDTAKSGLVSAERHIFDSLVVGTFDDRVHCGHAIFAGHSPAFLALDPHADNDHPHGRLSVGGDPNSIN